ncbi:thermonuclease family protein [Chelativorans salis]|uniref:Thermonuclease family protein n=1 Tax=Chelativorans salis TaxID=2978478 RepID=A0ABT2LPY5_9HYPH|nr:thermonuclease family protein [Chelativorans sp. EGI FJ00035]MCT7376547.1 thermonuclease family protein [Chelativorans sp. EGI FJ00035]
MSPQPPFYRLLAIAVAVLGGTPAIAGDLFPGPVEARVVRVIDGDTFVAEAHVWPGQTVTVSVRLRGVDAPEIRSRCEKEKMAGKTSRNALERLIGNTTVQIRNIGGDKYYGRVLADVTTQEGEGLAAHLLQRALVRTYAGGKRTSTCG